MDPEELKRAVLAMKNDDSTLGVKAMVKRLKEMGDVDASVGPCVTQCRLSKRTAACSTRMRLAR